MRKLRYTAAVLGLVIIGCGVATSQNAKQTLMGVSKQQVLVDAQHALALNGFDVEEVDLAKGEIISGWEKKNRRQIQYVVSVNDATGAPAEAVGDAGPSAQANSVEIVVQTNRRDKIVGGWSEATLSSSTRSASLLEDIVELSVNRYSSGEQVPLMAPVEEEKDPALEVTCQSTSECPLGKHCGSGYCIAECEAALECGAGYGCDDRGRCFVEVKPTPCPSAEGESEADGDDDKKAEEDDDDDKAAKRKARAERRKARKEKEEDDDE